ncbi:hypothetical protein [Rubripirellula reticaptiva]|uniref:Uncharacterized protein n=1 Tax=Rubripirellula reticaptiva TaxID=2528013 RepID=A0A5C6F1D8_9BACT|nr:hypothetical protein [Rubripirellula reticaptiva]TWU55168.1 hypothetical protein Poly59_14640 [Rubripirellula reticaptiva]
MITDDLQALYMLLRGSRSATSVLDARALVQENKAVAAHVKLIDAREAYMESRSRLLKQDPEKQFAGKSKEDLHNRKVLLRKQEKTREILKAFDELMPAIERMAKREETAAEIEKIKVAEEEAADSNEQPSPIQLDDDSSFDDEVPDDKVPEDKSSDDENDDGSSVTMLLKPSDVSEEFSAAFLNSDDDKRLDLVNGSYGFREVEGERDIYPSAVYLIRTGDKSFLVKTAITAATDTTVELSSLADKQSFKPFSRSDFIGLGKRRKMVLLTKTLSIDDDSFGQSNNSQTGETNSDGEHSQQHVLDMAAFSQLMTAAQRSGLFSGADQIGHVRDREFRLEKYDKAYQSIEAMHSRFSAAAGQRAQQLVRDEADISSGRVKISPKDLQAKRTRDRIQTQEVDRTERRFQIVLEGLRVLSAGVT